MAVRVRRTLAVLIVALAGSMLAEISAAPAAHAGRAGDFAEFAIPNSGANLVTGADGNLWWGDGSNIYRMTPAGLVSSFPTIEPGGHVVAPGPDGNIWYINQKSSNTTGNDVIGRVTPAGVLTETTITATSRRMQDLTAGPDGNMWILLQGISSLGDPLLVKITPSLTSTAYVEDAETRTSKIVAGPGGKIWWSRGNGNRLESVDPANPSGTLVTHLLPSGTNLSTNPDLAVGADGNLWFTDRRGGGNSGVGRMTPTDSTIEYPDRNDGSPGAIALGPDGNIWFTGGPYDTYPGKLISRISPDGTIKRFDISQASAPAGGNLTAGPDGNVWFFETSGTAIGRISPGGPPTSVVNLASGFSDSHVTLTRPGSNLQFVFTGPTAATATDTSGMGLFDSGTQSFPATYSTTFNAAGSYPYADSLQPSHTGVIDVPPKLSSIWTTRGANYAVQWATDAPPAGFVYDVQREDPGGAFADYLIGTTSPSSLERPGGPGTYAYRARLRRTSDDAASGYSPEVRFRYAGEPAQFDGQHTDLSIYRPSDGSWQIHSISGDISTSYGGDPGDVPVPGDYDGDGATDVAIFRPSTGLWAIHNSSDSSDVFVTYGGVPGDVPIPADYDGDGKTDLAIFRPDFGTWWIHRSSDSTDTATTFGVSGDIPVPGADFDGDGKADLVIYRDGTWYVHQSSDSVDTATSFGGPGDVPVPGYYDADAKSDFAVYRPSTGIWYTHPSTGPDTAVVYGVWGDVPAPGDYDGDGINDLAVFRPSNGTWYIHYASGLGDSITGWGTTGDVPLPLPSAVRLAFYP